MIRRGIWLAAAALGSASPVTGQSTYPLPGDVSSPEAIVAAAYEALQRAPGQNFQWDRYRSLFLPNSLHIPNTEQRRGAFTPLTTEEFIEWIDGVTTVGGPNDRGFQEEEIWQRIDRFGDVAVVFSTYQKHRWNDDLILGRGINAFQLVRHDDRWWIVGIVWDEESGAGALPDTYLP